MNYHHLSSSSSARVDAVGAWGRRVPGIVYLQRFFQPTHIQVRTGFNALFVPLRHLFVALFRSWLYLLARPGTVLDSRRPGHEV